MNHHPNGIEYEEVNTDRKGIKEEKWKIESNRIESNLPYHQADSLSLSLSGRRLQQRRRTLVGAVQLAKWANNKDKRGKKTSINDFVFRGLLDPLSLGLLQLGQI